MRLFRPWDSSRFLAALPKTTERICVLDRTKEQGSQGEPLLLEVASMLHASAHSEMVVIGGARRARDTKLEPRFGESGFPAVLDKVC